MDNEVKSLLSLTLKKEPLLAEAENSVQSQPHPQLQPQDENVAAREDRHDEGSSGVIASNDAAAALKGLLSPETQMVSDRIRRSISMGYFPFSLANALRMNQDEEARGLSAGQIGKTGYGSKGSLPSVVRPIAMTRSFSSGIFFANKYATGYISSMIPF
ncbi:hypothetical protein QQ045_024859 [Rhodiola kirilowii]